MAEHAEATGLEQRCVEPGHWLVEGYDVWRARDGHETYWLIERGGKYISTAVTLGDARLWIAGQI